MYKYQVTSYITLVNTMDVEAESETEAYEIAEDYMLKEQDYNVLDSIEFTQDVEKYSD